MNGKNLAIVIVVVTFILTAYGIPIPDKWHEAISEAVMLICTMLQTLDRK